MCKFTCLRVHILPNVGRLTRFSSMNLYCQGVITSTSGLPIGNLSQDHKCNSSGQPSIEEESAFLVHTVHKERYVAAKTADPKLRGTMFSSCCASAISRAILMKRAEIVSTWDSVNITLPNSHIRYASKHLVICGSVKATSGYPRAPICIDCTTETG